MPSFRRRKVIFPTEVTPVARPERVTSSFHNGSKYQEKGRVGRSLGRRFNHSSSNPTTPCRHPPSQDIDPHHRSNHHSHTHGEHMLKPCNSHVSDVGNRAAASSQGPSRSREPDPFAPGNRSVKIKKRPNWPLLFRSTPTWLRT